MIDLRAAPERAHRILALEDQKQQDNEVAIWYIEDFLSRINVVRFNSFAPQALIQYQNMKPFEKAAVKPTFFQQEDIKRYLDEATKSEKTNKVNYDWLREMALMIDRVKYAEYFKKLETKISEFNIYFLNSKLVFECYGTRFHWDKEMEKKLGAIKETDEFFETPLTTEQKELKSWWDK